MTGREERIARIVISAFVIPAPTPVIPAKAVIQAEWL
jgi:hypothetical protein